MAKIKKKQKSINQNSNQIMKEIENRAYEIFRTRNEETGDHLSDWLQAEKEINIMHSISK